MQYRIVDTGSMPRFYLWRRWPLPWWRYVASSENIDTLRAMVPALAPIALAIVGTRDRPPSLT